MAMKVVVVMKVGVMKVGVMNEELGLLEQGYTAVVMVAFGYRKTTDFNAGLPKSRLPEEEIFTVLS